MNSSRGNISNTKKALTEKKWNLKRINHGFGEREVPDSKPTHFFKYKLRFLGAKVNKISECLSFHLVLSPNLLCLYSILNGTFYRFENGRLSTF